MLCATLWYTRNGAVTLTHCPFRYSWVGSSSLPAGPAPLMPKRLLSWTARPLCPQPDSSMAWAMVTAAGTPYLRWAAMAPGTTALMNACLVPASFATGTAGPGWCRR